MNYCILLTLLILLMNFMQSNQFSGSFLKLKSENSKIFALAPEYWPKFIMVLEKTSAKIYHVLYLTTLVVEPGWSNEDFKEYEPF
jgi:hypothetical protein